MADHRLERERKFDVSSGFSLPQIGESAQQTYDLTATYYDTDDGLLQARGVTLRRRSGGKDDAWHLKAPHRDGRVEIHVHSDATEPPEEVLALTRGLRLERPLQERAVLRTTRHVYEFLTNDRELIAELADDEVEAVVASTQETRRWREIEVEIGPAGTPESGAELVSRLLAAGATTSAHGSKLARALGEPAPTAPLPGVGGLVDDYLRAQYERLAWGDLRLRRGEDVVHKTRVAVRRIRSTLRVFAPLFDSRAAHLDAELSWYADVLGHVRDLGVVRRTVGADLAVDSDGLIRADPAAVLDRILEERTARAGEELRTVLESARYRALLVEIDRWRRRPPMTPDAWSKPKRVERFVKRAEKRSDKRLARVASVGDDETDAALHRARKAAKRTRYAAELAQPKMGSSARRVARSHERRQETLGDFQDHVMTIAALREVASSSSCTAEVGFLCGVLAQRHSQRKQLALAEWR